MWPLARPTGAAILHWPSVPGPPSGQSCLNQGKADHLPAVYLAKTGFSDNRETGFIKLPFQLITVLAKKEHTGRKPSVFTFITESAMM